MESSAGTPSKIPLEVRSTIFPAVVLGVSLIILPEDPFIVPQGVSRNVASGVPPNIHPEFLL